MMKDERMEREDEVKKLDWNLLKRLLPYLKNHFLLVSVTVLFYADHGHFQCAPSLPGKK